MVLRYHYALPKMDVVSLGLAGGSIISVDPRSGTPRIGPRSAGSYPGPVCYDHGGSEPTVTDMDAVLGYLNPDFFLGGRARLDIEKAADVFEEKVAHPLGLPLVEAAAAIYRFANSLFFDLLHKTTVQRGLDPRKFALFSFGGTAGMHVCAYGEDLGVSHIVVPHSASVHGAYGLITSDIAHEDQITQPLRYPVSEELVADVFERLRERVVAQLREEGFDDDSIRFQRSIDMRYRRQVHIVTVPLADSAGPVTGDVIERTVAGFEDLYREKYGEESAYREAGIELVSFRFRGEGVVAKPQLQVEELDGDGASHAIVRRVEAWVDRTGSMEELPGYDFELLNPGNAFAGPAIVWTPITTLVVGAGQTAAVDEYKNIVVTSGART
jgi:N-methylhydantoinase A